MSRSALTVGIVIPVYNRADTVRRTLASLESLTYPHTALTVVVADDGSDEDIEGLVAAWNPTFTKEYVRQHHEGFGAGRARNNGADLLETDILVFLDSDALVTKDFVDKHVAHFDPSTPRVVIGGRVHLSAAEINEEDLKRGLVKFEAPATDMNDFRKVLSRRTGGYRYTDEGYRAFVSSNVSLPRDLHGDVGGFDSRFRWWGSEDTEYGWRLWQAGAEFVDDSDNAVYHQLDSDTAGGAEGRQKARELNRGLLTSLVPQRFYRRGMPSPTPETPKVSVIVHDPPLGAAEEWWHELTKQTLPDYEVIFVAAPADHDPFAGAAEGERRIRFEVDPDEAVSTARGEYVVFMCGSATPSRTAMQNVVKRLDQRPAAISLTFGVDVSGTGTFGLASDVESLEMRWQCPFPMGLAVRKRWLSQLSYRDVDLHHGLNQARAQAINTRQAFISLPSTEPAPRPVGFVFGGTGAKQIWEEAQLGPGQALKAGLRAVKERARPPRPATTRNMSVEHRPPGARYVGWVGKGNLGDEAMLDAAKALLPWADVEARGEARSLLLLGGGTLINRNQYLSWLTERDSPRLERAVLGTGVASPDYWGVTEDIDEWNRWLGTCAYVGVRGPRSMEQLTSWGVKAEIEVCGDLALALEPPEVSLVEGSVLVAPAATGGQLWGGSDDDVYAALADAAAKWIDQGRELILMSCHPSDDRPILIIREMLGDRPSSYHAGYLDVRRSLEIIASSELVVGERLHACVLAASAGRPFLGIEYRPKVADFAESVSMKDAVLRTDAVSSNRIVELASHVDELLPKMNDAVTIYRRRLTDASQKLRMAVEG